MAGRILIVEDDRSMAEMLEADLRLRGFTAVWCPTAEEALTQWQHDFDVVLTDLKLPGLMGSACASASWRIGPISRWSS